MGTVVSLDIRDPDVGTDVADEVFAWFHEVDARFSMYAPFSEMSRLARGELRLDEIHPDIREVLRLCEDVRLDSDGVFDIAHHRADKLLDPTGLVKGWSVDRAAVILADAGARHWAINAGGDIVAHGGREPGVPWRIGIQHPHVGDKQARVLLATDLAVATSGAYERGDHVVDARDGRAPHEVVSVTVVGPELAFADAYATAAFAMGRDGARWAARLRDYDACVITAADEVISTPGFERHVARA
jgi:FAD:protein FMN transferase